ncbi:MAG TPA: YfdX family protein [Methylothermaceae bacterium]|nr:YfdX family protein [Methylothermaceae bacterium]
MRLRKSSQIAVVFLLLAQLGWAAAAQDNRQAVQKEVQPQVQTAKQQAIAKKKEEAVKDALDAVLATRAALSALEQGKTKEALAHLEIANGKLTLLVARYPDLGLIPIDSDALVIDFQGDLKAIKKAVDEAEDLLDDGKVQDARALLTPLASEIRITTTHLPLAIYPEIIKKVAPLIDQGKIDAAKQTLNEALNTLVVTESVIPLPVLRAEAMLNKAATAAKAKAPEEQEVLRYLDNAMYQLRIAQALGYGDIDKDYKGLYKAIKELEKKIKRRQWGERIDRAMEELRKALGELRVRIGEPHPTK